PEPVGPLVTEEPRFTFTGPEGIVEGARPDEAQTVTSTNGGSEEVVTAQVVKGGDPVLEPESETPAGPSVTLEPTKALPSTAEETIHGGKESSGRRITIRALERPPRK
ncbi:MAG: hypothetical protein ACRD1T_08545, partial [Acidimicrobiia bacterium]